MHPSMAPAAAAEFVAAFERAWQLPGPAVGMPPGSWSASVETRRRDGGHAGSVSNLSMLGVRLLNSTPTRCTGTPRCRYLSA